MLVFNLLFMIEKRGLKIKIFVFVINLLFMFSFVSSQVENGPPVILERYDENGSLIPLNNSNNNPPHFIKEVDNFTLSRETPLTVDLKDYFEDSDGDLLLYSVWGVNEVYITFEEDKMTLNFKERLFRLFSKSNSNFEEYDIKPGESLKREYLSNKSVKNY